MRKPCWLLICLRQVLLLRSWLRLVLTYIPKFLYALDDFVVGEMLEREKLLANLLD